MSKSNRMWNVSLNNDIMEQLVPLGLEAELTWLIVESIGNIASTFCNGEQWTTKGTMLAQSLSQIVPNRLVVKIHSSYSQAKAQLQPSYHSVMVADL